MPGPTRRRKIHQGITTEKKKYRTKRRRRDIDQIVEDLDAKRARITTDGGRGSGDEDIQAVAAITPHKDLADLPGLGQHYCTYCARHFISAFAKEKHEGGKVHKKRVKETHEVPYSIGESEKAGGHGSYIAPPRTRPEISLAKAMEI